MSSVVTYEIPASGGTIRRMRLTSYPDPDMYPEEISDHDFDVLDDFIREFLNKKEKIYWILPQRTEVDWWIGQRRIGQNWQS